MNQGKWQKYKQNKVLAIFEVLVVRFVIYSLIANGLMLLIYKTTNPVPFPLEASYLIGSLWFLIPLVIIIGIQKNKKDFGISNKDQSKILDLVLSSFPYFIITGIGYLVITIFSWSYLEPPGALLLTLLFGISLLLITNLISKNYSNLDEVQIPKKKNRNNIITIIILLIFPIILSIFLNRFSFLIVSTIIWQFIFSGFGEELFFRGYIQSRLNQAFGRPYEWKGIKFGKGLFITAAIFALTHIINNSNILMGEINITIWWGTFTFVGGLLFGFLREKTGSVTAPGLLHGLEAIGEGLALLF